MASFEARALNRSTGGSGGRTIGQLRLPYHLVEPTVISADLIIVAISLFAGIEYNLLSLGVVPATATQTYTALGVLTFTNVSGGPSPLHVETTAFVFISKRTISRSSGPACSLCWSELVSENFSSGATLTLFALGLGGLYMVPVQLMAYHTAVFMGPDSFGPAGRSGRVGGRGIDAASSRHRRFVRPGIAIAFNKSGKEWIVTPRLQPGRPNRDKHTMSLGSCCNAAAQGDRVIALSTSSAYAFSSGRARCQMKSLILSFVLFTALCLPGLAGQGGNGQGGNGQGGNGQGYYGVPGPIAGAGLPVIAIGYGIYWLVRQRRRRKIN